MKRAKITISEYGMVSIPVHVQMQDFEIAELFEVMITTVRANTCDYKNRHHND